MVFLQRRRRIKKGSSRNTGECRPDLEEEVLLIAVAVGAA
ncbi:hypothetical protein L496_0210, partial [Bordetella holmesii CDC-H572-BH]